MVGGKASAQRKRTRHGRLLPSVLLLLGLPMRPRATSGGFSELVAVGTHASGASRWGVGGAAKQNDDRPASVEETGARGG